MRKKGLWAILLTAVLLSGCSLGGGQKDAARNSTVSEQESLQYSDTNDTETGAGQEEGSKEERPLSKEELRIFTNFVNLPENNGFLLSEYAKPEEVDLGEVLYNGAGMENAPLTEEERSAYLAEGYGIETDITNLSGKQIDAFLQKKLGITLSDSKTGLEDWFYFEGNDCYLQQHGDTNWVRFVCTSGVEVGDGLFVLHCKAADDAVPDCMLTLQKADDSCRFVFNFFEENTDDERWIRKIEDQSFSVELNGWGNVEFVSYEPDRSQDSWTDATFELQWNGKTLYTFPPVGEDNIRFNRWFDSVDAVSFQDYDGDGNEDVIIICTYELTAGPDVGSINPTQEARIYKGTGNGFTYMESLSNQVNFNSEELSIAGIMEQIAVDANAAEGLDADVKKQLEIFADARALWLYTDWSGSGEYAVYDLDGDGRLELLAEVVMGTGLYAENHFYQVNAAGDGIVELPQDYYAEYPEGGGEEFEIAWADQQAFRDENTGTVYYMVSDSGKNGAAEYWSADGAYYLEGGRICNVAYRGRHDLYTDGGDSVTVTYYDAQGNEIEEAAWNRLYEDFISGKAPVTREISWKSVACDEAEAVSEQEIFALLAQSYKEKTGD